MIGILLNILMGILLMAHGLWTKTPGPAFAGAGIILLGIILHEAFRKEDFIKEILRDIISRD